MSFIDIISGKIKNFTEKRKKNKLNKRIDRIKGLREDSNRYITLYHKTTPDIAAAILSNKSFIKGSNGTQGAGIYFATNPKATHNKAVRVTKQDGVILQCSVVLGNIMFTSKTNRSMSFEKMLDKGFDSIMYNGATISNGVEMAKDDFRNSEYIVYSLDQIIGNSIKTIYYSPTQSITKKKSTIIDDETYEWDEIWTNRFGDINLGLNNVKYNLVSPNFQAAHKANILSGQSNSKTYIGNNGVSRMGYQPPSITQKTYETNNNINNAFEMVNHNNSNGVPIKIVTLNINYANGYDTLNIFFSNTNVTQSDVICLQESPSNPRVAKLFNDKMNINNFTLLYEVGGDSELIQIWINNNSEWNECVGMGKKYDLSEITTDVGIYNPLTPNCKTKRIMPLFSLINRDKEIIKIGVVHLCGGRYDEEYHSNMLDIRLKNLKIKVLKDMVKGNADIILGDFNSDKENTNIDFLLEKGFSPEGAKQWNEAPSIFLESKNYKYISNNKPTSTFGGIPDMIWYKQSRLNKKEFDIINMNAVTDPISKYNHKTQSSDHNGLYAELTFINPLNIKGMGKSKKKRRKKTTRKKKKTKNKK